MYYHDRIRVPKIIAVIALFGLFLSAGIFADEDNTGRPTKQSGSTEPTGTNLLFVPHQLVVRTQSHSADMSFMGRSDVMVTRQALANSPVYLLDLDPAVDEQKVAEQISAIPSVVFAHPNYLVNRSFPIQGSYPFPDQNLTGDMDDQYASDLLNLSGAHQIATGARVTVGVIDCGVDFAHPRLGGAAISGWDFVQSDDLAFDEPDGKISGHGTFVAGLIHLTAPGAVIKSYRVLNQNGYGDGFTLAGAIEQAANDGCDVINLSVALTERHLAVRDAIDYAVSKGVTVIAGAGNDGDSTVSYPAAESNVLAVGAVDSLMHVADFSNVGSALDIFAPGENTYSAFVASGYAWWSGTSFATPFASGLAALLKQQEPAASWLRIRQRIFGGAIPIDTLNPGMFGKLGRGMVNPVGSLNYTSTSDSATFIPDTLHLTHHIGQMYILPPTVSGLLVSTKDPAPFVPSIVDTGVGLFVWVDDTSGNSGDSVRIFTSPERFSEGVYYNTIAFTVVGIPEPAYATVCLTVLGPSTNQDAWLTPPDLYLTVPHTQSTPVFGSSVLSSANAPAAFTAVQRPEVSHAVRIIDTSGYTNDSVRFYFVPTEFFSPGSYDDTIFYNVAGIANPVPLALHITITNDTLNGATAWFMPPDPVYNMPVGAYRNVVISVYSTNQPATFSAYLPQPVPFIHLTRANGVTPDTVSYQVDARGMTPGTYQTELHATVAGVANQITTTITLIVEPASPDSGWLLPNTKQFQAPGGVPYPTQGEFSVATTGPSYFFVAVPGDTRDFVRLIDTIGTTPATIRFNIVPSNTNPGVYVDFIDVYVFGINNSPLRFVAYLSIDSSGGGTVSVIPNPLNVSVPPANYDTLLRQVLITSSGGPRSYVSWVTMDLPKFVYLRDTTGFTNDSANLYICPFGLPAGVYVNHVNYSVSGIPGTTTLTATLTVSASGAATATVNVELTNYPNPFNPSTTISFSLPRSGYATLEVYDLLGRQVATLMDGFQTAGEHLVPWDGRNRYGESVASGIYFYRLTTENESVSKKMLLLK